MSKKISYEVTSVANAKSNSDLLYDHFYREKFFLSITEEDREMARTIIDYLKGLSFKAIERELTDFERNVLKLVTGENIEKDKIGIASSLPKVYYNKIEDEYKDIYFTGIDRLKN